MAVVVSVRKRRGSFIVFLRVVSLVKWCFLLSGWDSNILLGGVTY